MKTTFKMVAKDGSKTTIDVKFEASRFDLTRGEVIAKKEALKNKMHTLLREFGYNTSEISVVKQ